MNHRRGPGAVNSDGGQQTVVAAGIGRASPDHRRGYRSPSKAAAVISRAVDPRLIGGTEAAAGEINVAVVLIDGQSHAPLCGGRARQPGGATHWQAINADRTFRHQKHIAVGRAGHPVVRRAASGQACGHVDPVDALINRTHHFGSGSRIVVRHIERVGRSVAVDTQAQTAPLNARHFGRLNILVKDSEVLRAIEGVERAQLAIAGNPVPAIAIVSGDENTTAEAYPHGRGEQLSGAVVFDK